MEARIYEFAPLMPAACVAVAAILVLLIESYLFPWQRGEEEDSAPSRLASVVLTLISSVALAAAAGFAWLSFGSGADLVFDSGRPMLQIDAFTNLVPTDTSSPSVSDWSGGLRAGNPRLNPKTPPRCKSVLVIDEQGAVKFPPS